MTEELTDREIIHLALTHGWSCSEWELERYGCKIVRSISPPSSEILADLMEASRICAAVLTQPKPINYWLQFCYGDDSDLNWHWHGKQVCWYLVGRFSHGWNDTLIRLTWMAVEDARKRMNEKPGATEEVLRAGMNCLPWQWDQLYRKRFRKYLDKLTWWDRDGVGRVSITIRQVREGKYA